MGYAFFILMLAVAALMIPFCAAAYEGAVSGLKLFTETILPTVFPFLVCANCISGSGVLPALMQRSGFLSRFFLWAFTAFCGTPSSPVLFNDLTRDGVMEQRRASFLCGLTNQMGPNFIVLALCGGFFGRRELAWLFAVSHYTPALLLSALFFKTEGTDGVFAARKPAELFPAAVSEAVSAVLRIGGTIVFFSVIRSLFDSIGPLRVSGQAKAFLMGMIEMTNGLSVLASDTSRLTAALCAFVLSFEGLCIFTQSKLVFPSLNAGLYLAAKLMHGAASFISAYLLYPVMTKALPVFGSMSLDSFPQAAFSARKAAMICTCASAVFSLTVILISSRLVKRK